jgi:hypothetical protein
VPLHNIYPTKEVKVWFVQKWFDDGMFSGRWEWVEDAESKGAATQRAKQLKKEKKGYYKSNYRIDRIKSE